MCEVPVSTRLRSEEGHGNRRAGGTKRPRIHFKGVSVGAIEISDFIL